MAYTVTNFVADVDRVLKEKGETIEMEWSLGPRLQRLVLEGGDLTLQGKPSTGSTGLGGRILHVDPAGRFRLIVARFPSGQPTPVHAHHRWGLECGVSGRERFTVYERVDDGSEKGKAELEVFADHHIERGDLGYWYDSPRNIHRQWAEGGEPSCVIILMGGDGSRQHLFDLSSGTYTEA
jgi:predicted metal-dependent enzyme (double-stranded beta helix superfamily)